MKKMSTIVSMLMIVSLVFSSTADARKMGGSQMGRTYKTAPAPAKSQNKPNAGRHASAQKSTSTDKQYSQQGNQQQKSSGLGMLGGALAGLAAGGLLASLFGGGTFSGIQGADFLVLIALALAAFFLLRHFRRRKVAYADSSEKTDSSYLFSSFSDTLMTKKPAVDGIEGADAHFVDELKETAPISAHSNTGILGGTDVPENLPAAFDQDAFLDRAREHYVTLQKAWNDNDLSVMREYMTPELLQQTIQKRSELSELQHTEILFLDATIVRADYSARVAQISVNYIGRYKDEVEDIEEDLNDIWHLERDITQNNTPWRIVGME